jgi:hypothetical protein
MLWSFANPIVIILTMVYGCVYTCFEAHGSVDIQIYDVTNLEWISLLHPTNEPLFV